MISTNIETALRSLILALVIWPFCERSVIAQKAPIPAIAISGTVFARLQDEPGGTARVLRHCYMIAGDSYALIRGNCRENMALSGDMRTIDIGKARKLAQGDFVWFERGDKQYCINDPVTVAQIEAIYKPIEEVGEHQEELGREQEELGKRQESIGRRQEQARGPFPDIQKEIAEINAVMDKLNSTTDQNVNRDEVVDLQNKLGDLRRRLRALEGKRDPEEGERGLQEGQLGAQEGKLGAEEGRLGADQRRLERDADRKVRLIIDGDLTDGKARPLN